MSKFKVGDSVTVIQKDRVASGRAGTVVEYDGADFRPYRVFFPDLPSSHWFDERHLELASSTAKFFVVYHGDGEPAYDTKEIAEARAEDLARMRPGDGYAVLRIEAVITANIPPVTVERF